MQSSLRSQLSGRVGFVGAAGVLVSVLMLSGCPGTLDPTQFMTGTGGTNATGGSGSGTGGSNPTGGSTGKGGSSGNCTGGNDGATIMAVSCAITGCHDPSGATFSGGLDLTVDANIGSRLVGVTSVGTASNGSQCVGNSTPYLDAGSNPATGLLIDKVQQKNPPCGAQMPFAAPFPLTATQQSCLIQWATTLTSP